MMNTLVLDEPAGDAADQSDAAAVPIAGGIPNPYPLKHPIKVAWKGAAGERVEEITELELRRATGKELLLVDRLQGQPMQLILSMIAALSGRPVKIIEQLDGEDIGPLAELAFGNVPDGRPTGGSTSPA